MRVAGQRQHHRRTEDSQLAAEELVESIVVDFLDQVNPDQLEAAALQSVGGLEGDESIGQSFLNALKAIARGE